MLVHLRGTMCSGKTWAQSGAINSPNVVVWDIREFYEKRKCFKPDGEMDWTRYMAVIPCLREDVIDFIKNGISCDKIFIIESAGNVEVTSLLSGYSCLYIELPVPSVEVLTQRAQVRKQDPTKVLKFAEIYRDRYSMKSTHTAEEAKILIEALASGQRGRILVHQVNCQGVMGAGLAKEIRTRFPKAFSSYKKACDNKQFKPEMIQMVKIDPLLWVCNLAGQDRYGVDKQYTDYAAIKVALDKLDKWAFNHPELDILIPKGMGCGLGGGNWTMVCKLVTENCSRAKIVDPRNGFFNA